MNQAKQDNRPSDTLEAEKPAATPTTDQRGAQGQAQPRPKIVNKEDEKENATKTGAGSEQTPKQPNKGIPEAAQQQKF